MASHSPEEPAATGASGDSEERRRLLYALVDRHIRESDEEAAIVDRMIAATDAMRGDLAELNARIEQSLRRGAQVLSGGPIVGEGFVVVPPAANADEVTASYSTTSG